MVNINIQKKDLWLLSAIMIFLVGVAFVVAYGSGQPTVHGHDAGEVEGGEDSYIKTGFGCITGDTAVAYRTTPKTCQDSSCTPCTTGSHDWAVDGNYQETCQYQELDWVCGGLTLTCYANSYTRCSFVE